MRKLLLLLFVLWITADRAPAQTLTQTASAANVGTHGVWSAVGRVNLIGTGFCTGALIAPDLVLTAAHCMFDKRTGKRVGVDKVEFLAGWAGGRAVAERFARRVAIHPKYRYLSTHRLERVATDLALVELERPIDPARVAPFRRASRARIGDTVDIVSYPRGTGDDSGLHRRCGVMGRDPGVVMLSCKVTFGESGSPIFVLENGVPRIASVVSAKAEWKSRDVALATELGAPLEALLRSMRRNDLIVSLVGDLRAD